MIQWRRQSGRLAAQTVALAALLALGGLGTARAADGYRLWLRYVPVHGRWLERYRHVATELVPAAGPRQTAHDIGAELGRGLTGMLGRAVPNAAQVTTNGAILFGTPKASPLIRSLRLDLARVGSQGYLIRTLTVDGHRTTVIAGNTDIGVLYGAFRFLRLMQTRRPIGRLDILSRPKLRFRVLDFWDNLRGTVERGYAGSSIWKWNELPQYLSPRYTAFARACASIGINGVVLNNVNATPYILTPLYLGKVAALAAVLRPYGIRVYLSVPFNAPITVGHLKTANPLDPAVQAWWRTKVAQIYHYVPNFGGFLAKADSEGEPGPAQYGLTQAQGANLFARALAPYGGIVMWRTFVYSTNPHSEDRVMQAYDIFKPLDGKFDSNVILQNKNGPLDFQPREPFNPLFGAMPKTNEMMELEITKEYLGQQTSLVYLGTLYEQALRADTWARGRGSTVERVIDGSLYGERDTGMAGVANIGSDRNWCGSIFNQSNWYVFGRLAWNPNASARAIAADWVRMTFTNNPAFVRPVVHMMMISREAVVDYMDPLGLASQMAAGTHFGPGPWVHPGPHMPPDWSSTYYSRANAEGIGFNRTATGSDAVAQYAPHVAAQFASLKHCPQDLLLWFHHVPWTYRLRSGHTLWDSLLRHYQRGVNTIRRMRKTWAGLSRYVDPQRFRLTAAFLALQQRNAQWWRDASIAYWQSISHLPLPPGIAPPPFPLKAYEAFCVPYAGISGAGPACPPYNGPVPY